MRGSLKEKIKRDHEEGDILMRKFHPQELKKLDIFNLDMHPIPKLLNQPFWDFQISLSLKGRVRRQDSNLTQRTLKRDKKKSCFHWMLSCCKERYPIGHEHLESYKILDGHAKEIYTEIMYGVHFSSYRAP